MCVIISKEIGKELPSKEFLKKAWTTNPDGAGFMFNLDDTIYGYKGFMTFKGFYKFLKSVDNTVGLKNKNVVMHFRIATHGEISKENTHPFIISDDEKKLKDVNFVSTVGGFAHNGILSGYGSLTQSDSMEFCKEIVSTVKDFDNTFDLLHSLACHHSSRFAILTPAKMYLCGNWQKIGEFYCSNDYFNVDYSKYDCGNNWKYIKNRGYCEDCACYSYNLKEIDGLQLCTDCYNYYIKYLLDNTEEVKTCF